MSKIAVLDRRAAHGDEDLLVGLDIARVHVQCPMVTPASLGGYAWRQGRSGHQAQHQR